MRVTLSSLLAPSSFLEQFTPLLPACCPLLSRNLVVLVPRQELAGIGGRGCAESGECAPDGSGRQEGKKVPPGPGRDSPF